MPSGNRTVPGRQKQTVLSHLPGPPLHKVTMRRGTERRRQGEREKRKEEKSEC